MSAVCPACDAATSTLFHTQSDVPVNSCLLLDNQEEALDFPTGEIHLRVCHRCGFVFNAALEPALIEYSSRYEETQSFSPRFRTFTRNLAARWVDRYDLVGRRVLEIGCGKGDFLVELCRNGVGDATGIDPAVAPHRLDDPVGTTIRWIPDRYDERYARLDADAIVCRHTLEHIPDVADFLATIRRSIGDRHETVVLFEVPDVLRVLREVAFWDVYYEHCSYFSPGSLARLFRRSGFEILALWLGFDDQYIVVEAAPAGPGGGSGRPHPLEEHPDTVTGAAQAFRDGYERKLDESRNEIATASRSNGGIAIWGAGSKGVAYLTGLSRTGSSGNGRSASRWIDQAVDINPFKQGRYLAGSGLPVVEPAALQRTEPELVIAMNPVYVEEIGRELREMGLDTRLIAV